MTDNGALSQALQTSEPLSGSIGQSSQPPPPSSVLSRESAGHLEGWEIIGEQQDFYDEQDCLHPSHNLASAKLGTRKEDDVVIFGYSLDPDYLKRTDGNPPVEEGAASLGHFSADDDIFFRVSKNELTGSEQFDQIINPPREPRQSLPQGPRLGIIDFPQCYDTHDDGLLNLMAQKLGLQQEGETAFMDTYSRRVRALPGHERFRTGVLLRAPFKESTELSGSEDRFILFVSFPYFGGSSEEITLDQQRESLNLLDFRLLGVDARDRKVKVSEEGKAGIGEILVHQARYMIFDNYTMATFRSKEDNSRDQVPLHRFQERVGAFRAMIHMIANRTELELRTLGRLQASLHKLEEDIDQMILDANDHEDHQGAKKKQERVRDLLTALNRLSVDLFAAISVAERQMAILRDLHSVFLTSYRTKTKDYERGYPLRRNPFYRNVAPIPILSENPEQIWPNTLDTINEVVEERKSFIKKVRELVENMDIRRKIFAAFLKSDQAKAAPSEETAQKTIEAVKSTEDAIKKSQAEIVKQGQTLSGFTLYYGMQTMKEFGGDTALLSLRQFWLATAPTLVGILLLTLIIVLWKRDSAIKLRTSLKEKLSWPSRKKRSDIETPT